MHLEKCYINKLIDLKYSVSIIFDISDAFRTPAVTWLTREHLNQSPAKTQRRRISTMSAWHRLSFGGLTVTWARVRLSWPRNSSAWSSKIACRGIQTWATTRVWPSTPPACWHLPTPLRVLSKLSSKPVCWRGRHSRRHASTGKVTSPWPSRC